MMIAKPEYSANTTAMLFGTSIAIESRRSVYVRRTVLGCATGQIEARGDILKRYVQYPLP
jgi:putative salt-induced outer membrane protein YdiY